MKLLNYIIILSLLFMCNFSIFAQTRDTLTYTVNFQPLLDVRQNIPIQQKSNRIHSHAGKIIIETDEVLPDSVKTCIDIAVDLWESCLNFRVPIHLKMLFVESMEENDIEVDVSYYSSSSIYYPTSLYLQSIGVSEDGSTDATIRINKNSEWNCSNNISNNSLSRNLTFALIRSIAHALGFGSSVTKKKRGGVDFITFGLKQGHSIFDTYVYSSNGERLSDIDNIGVRYSEDLYDFVQPTIDSIFVSTDNNNYKLYAPSTFKKYESLQYFDNDSSLMCHSPGLGLTRLRIDGALKDVLTSIGWELNPIRQVEIKSVDIGDDGIGSAYSSHQFYIQNNTNYEIQDKQWIFTLPSVSGNEVTITTSSGSDFFTIPSINNENAYQININGDIYGNVCFSGTINGIEVEDHYRVSLELKPRIVAVHRTATIDNAPFYSQDIYLSVCYLGTDSLTISLEEEYGSTLRTQIVREPFYAHVVVGNVASYGYAWIDITASNQYGIASYTEEIEPTDNAKVDVLLNINNIKDLKDIEYIDIHDTFGNRLSTLGDERELSCLGHGIYILSYHLRNGNVKRTKYLVK